MDLDMGFCRSGRERGPTPERTIYRPASHFAMVLYCKAPAHLWSDYRPAATPQLSNTRSPEALSGEGPLQRLAPRVIFSNSKLITKGAKRALLRAQTGTVASRNVFHGWYSPCAPQGFVHRRTRGTGMVSRKLSLAFGGLIMMACVPSLGEAQYFGRQKVQYEDFDWRVLHTPRFDIHYYPEELEVTQDAARMSERWYSRLSRAFQH